MHMNTKLLLIIHSKTYFPRGNCHFYMFQHTVCMYLHLLPHSLRSIFNYCYNSQHNDFNGWWRGIVYAHIHGGGGAKATHPHCSTADKRLKLPLPNLST